MMLTVVQLFLCNPVTVQSAWWYRYCNFISTVPYWRYCSHCVQKKFLTHVHNPTSCRGSNKPSILIWCPQMVTYNAIDYLSHLTKSDHYVLSITCDFNTFNKTFGEQFNYSKGDCDNLRNFMDIDWTQSLAQCADIEEMWNSGIYRNYSLIIV